MDSIPGQELLRGTALSALGAGYVGVFLLFEDLLNCGIDPK